VEQYNTGIGDDKAHFEAKIAKMEDSEAIQDLKKVLSTAKQLYELSTNVPAAKTQIPLLEEKIAICESRISDLEAENTNQSKDKVKLMNNFFLYLNKSLYISGGLYWDF
jgi:predicted  nucleic acid-binding Zn-ribbon protein